MTAVLQRVTSAAVSVDGEVVGSCGRGWFILLGVEDGDEKITADTLAGKISRLRMFEDEDGKLNLSMTQVGGGALVVSNFTLCADCRKGNRPSFTASAAPAAAEALYEYFVEALAKEAQRPIESGRFGADMKIESSCDGPVTVILRADNSGKIL